MGKEHFKIISEFVSDCLIVRDDISQDERVKVIEALSQCQKEVDGKEKLVEDLRDVTHNLKALINANTQIIIDAVKEKNDKVYFESEGENNAFKYAIEKIIVAVNGRCVEDTND